MRMSRGKFGPRKVLQSNAYLPSPGEESRERGEAIASGLEDFTPPSGKITAAPRHRIRPRVIALLEQGHSLGMGLGWRPCGGDGPRDSAADSLLRSQGRGSLSKRVS